MAFGSMGSIIDSTSQVRDLNFIDLYISWNKYMTDTDIKSKSSLRNAT